MNTLTLFILFIPVLVLVLLVINQFTAVSKPYSEKVSPYECGFTPLGDARQKFSIQFYLVAILFIVFDIEVLFLFPFAVVLYESSIVAFWVAIIFLIILTIGFVYEWSKGALKFTAQSSSSSTSSSYSSGPQDLPKAHPFPNSSIQFQSVRRFSTLTGKDHKDLSNSHFKLWTYLATVAPVRIYLNTQTERLNILNELKGFTGIYLWYNRITSDFYVGSAKDLSNRLARYYRSSELNRIKGNLIYASLLAYGHDNFSLYILEFTTKDNVLEREQYYFDLFIPTYNLLKFASSSASYQHTEEAKKLMSEIKQKDPELLSRIALLAEINRGKKHSEEFKQRRSELTTGTNNPNFGKGNSIKEIDTTTNLITTYSSVTNAAKAHNTSRDAIRYCIKNGTLYKSRYKFFYVNPPK